MSQIGCFTPDCGVNPRRDSAASVSIASLRELISNRGQVSFRGTAAADPRQLDQRYNPWSPGAADAIHKGSPDVRGQVGTIVDLVAEIRFAVPAHFDLRRADRDQRWRRKGKLGHDIKLPGVSRAGQICRAQISVPLETSVLFVPRFSAKVVVSPATERLVVEA